MSNKSKIFTALLSLSTGLSGCHSSQLGVNPQQECSTSATPDMAENQQNANRPEPLPGMPWGIVTQAMLNKILSTVEDKAQGMAKAIFEEVKPGDDINARYYGGETLLHKVVFVTANEALIKRMQAWGGDVLLKNNEDQTPLDYARMYCKPEVIIDALIEAQALREAQEKVRVAQAQYKKQQELMQHYQNNHEVMVQQLTRLRDAGITGAAVDFQSDNLRINTIDITLLESQMQAQKQEEEQFQQALMELEQRNRLTFGMSSETVTQAMLDEILSTVEAKAQGMAKAIFEEVKPGDDINARYTDGETLFHKVASYTGKEAVIERMQAWGANVLLTDNYDQTPLDYARACRKPQVIIDALVEAANRQALREAQSA